MTLQTNWYEHNQRYLVLAFEHLRNALAEQPAARQAGAISQRPELLALARATTPPPALVTLTQVFGLSPFEQDLLLLCAGVEMDSSLAARVGAAQGDPQRQYVTMSMALAALPNPVWNALTPGGALRRWGLIEVTAGHVLTTSPLRINERVLHYLAGVQQLDERLAGLMLPIADGAALPPSQVALAEQLAGIWSQPRKGTPLPAIQLCGAELATHRAVAAAACTKLGLKLYAVMSDVFPNGPVELEALARLWEREAALLGAALLIDCSSLEGGDAGRAALVGRFVDRLNGAVLISTRERLNLASRPLVTLEVGRPSVAEQRTAWRQTLGPQAELLNGTIDRLVNQFSLSPAAITTASLVALGKGYEPAHLAEQLWEASRAEARPRMEGLAQRIDTLAGWNDLVLPEAQIRTLRAVADQVRQRARVYDEWGFGSRGARGLGISALFAGTSGTGKTLAAEVIANELRLDLYRIDLSAVVSKYIGETEKNLRRIFDAAEEGGVILLFDEADALFGKRSEVKDSHDRYANIEVSYLLQRMESYRGLAILTTNLKGSIDSAFLRRIRFVVQFPFPDASMRRRIWDQVFPEAMPRERLDAGRLAQLNIAGGNIKNIALNAAFLAAAVDSPVRMSHIRRAAHSEYTKLEKTLTDAEVAGWGDE